MTASENCYALIRRFEGLKLKAYRCPSGILTVGYGHTRGVTEGMEITQARADELLHEDVASVERELRVMLPNLELTQGQWDALVSLGFNLRGGPRSIPVTAPKFWKALHSGDKRAAANEMYDINLSNGKPLAGLTNRRKAEAELFLS